MSKSLVALVGRPNVGKSTLFNRLIGQRLSIVADQAGTTRDRVQAPCEWNGVEFTLVDTGGIEPLEPLRDAKKAALATASKDFVHEIRDQAEMAIAEADVLVFTVDAQVGLTATDEAVAEILRKLTGQRQRQGKSIPPILVAVSKSEGRGGQSDAFDFYKLGFGDVYAVSGLRGDGTGDLLDAVVAAIPPKGVEEVDETLKIALVGRPNVGKSSLFNALLGEDRVIVSNVPGTTRDAIDTLIEYKRVEDSAAGDELGVYGGKPVAGALDSAAAFDEAEDQDATDDDAVYDPADFDVDDGADAHDAEPTPNRTVGDAHTRITLIDTAGIRKRGSIEQGIEKFSVLRSMKSIARADVALLLIDAVDGVTAQDEHVAGYVLDENKSVIVLVNKWDLIESPDKVERIAKHVPGWGLITPKMQEYITAIQKRFNFMPYVPIMFISAKFGFRIDTIFSTAIAVNEARNMRITTSQLMDVVRDASMRHSPPIKAGRRLKVYMAQQTGVNPPTFVLHVNDTNLVHFGYERFLENRIREKFGFLGTPLRFLFRGRRAKDMP
jgi:GTP-binding protein